MDFLKRTSFASILNFLAKNGNFGLLRSVLSVRLICFRMYSWTNKGNWRWYQEISRHNSIKESDVSIKETDITGIFLWKSDSLIAKPIIIYYLCNENPVLQLLESKKNLGIISNFILKLFFWGKCLKFFAFMTFIIHFSPNKCEKLFDNIILPSSSFW